MNRKVLSTDKANHVRVREGTFLAFFVGYKIIENRVIWAETRITRSYWEDLWDAMRRSEGEEEEKTDVWTEETSRANALHRNPWGLLEE